jgi:hypothetical protein
VSDTIFVVLFFLNRLRTTWRTAVDDSFRNTGIGYALLVSNPKFPYGIVEYDSVEYMSLF